MAKDTPDQLLPEMEESPTSHQSQHTPPRLDAITPSLRTYKTLARRDWVTPPPRSYKTPTRLDRLASLYHRRPAGRAIPLSAQRRPIKALASKLPYRMIRHRRQQSVALPVFIYLAGGGLSSVLLLFLTIFGIIANYAYSYYLEEVNALSKLRLASGFENSRIYDRHGKLLYEFASFGRRDQVTLDQVSPVMVQATIDVEDKDFWTNNGIDFLGTLRATSDNIRFHRVVSGASTITQQLIKNTLLSAEVGNANVNRTIINRKIPEAILSYGLTQQYSKQQILQMYLNTIYYGNLAYGLKAATYAYFGGETDPAKQVDVSHLDLAHASILAGLPQSPNAYNPFQHPQVTFARQKDVLKAMVSRHDITNEEALQAQAIARQPGFFKAPHPLKLAPHFVDYIQHEIERMFNNGSLVLNGSGLRIETSIDLDLQNQVQAIVQRHVKEIADHHVSNGAAVVLDTHTGEILAMVGSADYNDLSIDGQFNVVAEGLRQPGSSFKPFAYVTAFSKGWSPGTMVLDAPTTFPGYPDPYKPQNYDLKFHGLVSLRSALANSYNIPAIKVLQYAGIPDTLRIGQAFGLSSLRDPSNYGLSLVLGGAEVTPLELTSAYSVFANLGARIPHRAIRRIITSTGQVLLDFTTHPPHAVRVISPQLAYLMTDILKDNAARVPEFGYYNPLRLEADRPAAAKTGTTNDFRDNWTIGYTPEYVVGAWVGNSDNTPMENIIGIDGAGPIWHDTMEYLEANKPFSYFQVPDGLERVSLSVTGRRASFGFADFVITNAAPKEYDNGSISAPTYTAPKPYIPAFRPYTPFIPYWPISPPKPTRPKPAPPISTPAPVLPPRTPPPPMPKH